MSSVRVLEVLLHDQQVGTLTNLYGDQNVFAFSDEYARRRGKPVLSLSFQDEHGDLITAPQSRRNRLPEFFSNLLPEGPLREYLARRAGVHPDREFFLLWALGRDLPGAVTVRSPEGEPSPGIHRGDAGHGHLAGEGGALRFSLAGVQLKFSAVRNAAGGLTIPASGSDGDWIVKLPSAVHDAVPINEFVMMSLARNVGIDVPEVRLVALSEIDGLPSPFDDTGESALAVRRFDRLGGGAKRHIEDFAQVFGVYPEDKYARGNYRSIAEVVQIEAGTDAVREFIRRLTYSALIGNADMHLKNWSLLYRADGTPTLAPAYDLVSTIPYPVERGLGLNLYKPGTKRFADFTLENLKRLAERARLSQLAVIDTARETVERFLEAWTTGPERNELPSFIRDAVDAHYPTIPLVGEVG